MGLSSTSLATLSRQAHDAVELAPGLRSVLGEALERGIGQQPPEFIHPAHQPPAIEQLAHQMKQVQRDRRAGELVIEELRDVEANDGAARPAAATTESAGLSNTQA